MWGGLCRQTLCFKLTNSQFSEQPSDFSLKFLLHLFLKNVLVLTVLAAVKCRHCEHRALSSESPHLPSSQPQVLISVTVDYFPLHGDLSGAAVGQCPHGPSFFFPGLVLKIHLAVPFCVL